MKNNIKKASEKFWEDLLYFQHLCRFLSLPQISDYHHLISLKYNRLSRNLADTFFILLLRISNPKMSDLLMLKEGLYINRST